MFLIRAAFWLSLVVFLLPADPHTGEQAPRVTAIEALVAARAAVVDLSDFCDRNADVCTTGTNAFQLFADKLSYGVHLIQGYFDRPPVDDGSGTLKREDLQPPWHGAGKEDRSA
jgi:hypothetical protein